MIERLCCAGGLVICLASCGDGAVAASSTSINGSSTESESGSSEPDLPSGPQCPATLGEVVSCECAMIEGCSIADSEHDDGCEFACDVPSPCPTVVCMSQETDSGCADVLDVDALECVFEALGEGQPMRWETRRRIDYVTTWEASRNQFLRLDTTTYVRSPIHVYWFDGGDITSIDRQGFAAIELPESEWMVCEALPTDQERFSCLHWLGAAAEPCTDASMLVCP